MAGAADGHELAEGFLTGAGLAALLEVAKGGRHGIRDHLLLIMMFYHGLRVSEPLTRQVVSYVVGATAKRAGLPGVHPHTLSHSCGYYLANKSHDLRLIRSSLLEIL